MSTPPPLVFKSLSFQCAPAPQVAGAVGLRIAAAVADLAVSFALFGLMAAAIGTFDTSHGLFVRLEGAPALLWLAVMFLYFLLGEALTGRTLGKAAFGLRVVDVHDGSQPGLRAIALRTLLRSVDGLPVFYGLGLLLLLLSPDSQRIGDVAARTTVVRAGGPGGR